MKIDSPEDIKSEKEITTSTGDKKNNIIWETIKHLLKTTWGMRIGLVILGFLLFFLGYVIGNFGKSSLKKQIKDKTGEINDLITVKDKLSLRIKKMENEIVKIKKNLYNSKSKMKFIEMRNKIKTLMFVAIDLWKKRDNKSTEEKIWIALDKLKLEANGSMGIEQLFYNTVIRRLEMAITDIKTGCSPKNKDNKSSNKGGDDIVISEECHKKILKIIINATVVLNPK